ncbi:hypothetical protein BS47DRAFT_1362549 [Hydnum rufescens UP504]|uniref:Uncharacterized protein n=1 Tax=Hydnum rufescens UP504 TaxID=1448309 RepID=A0A9P6AWZ4_9AGAM|nr:hypothetical protein BS47DRAFT_1362549 [Hydnum rufescens UP504]
MPHKEMNHTPAVVGISTHEDPPRTITHLKMGSMNDNTPHKEMNHTPAVTWDNAKTSMNHTPAITGVWFYTRFLPEPPPNKPPPPLEMTTHLPTESCKCDPPNETQKQGHTMQGPGTQDKPHTHFGSHENRNPQTPKMTPTQYKTVPHTYFGGIQIKTPEMTTHPSSNPHPMVKCQATPLTTPTQTVQHPPKQMVPHPIRIKQNC